MSEILLINASPRRTGTSSLLAGMGEEYLRSKGRQVTLVHLYHNLNHRDSLLQAIKAADTIVLSGPCYINTYPAETTAFLQWLAEQKDLIRGKNLYGIIQGGMPYPHTHECGLLQLQVFCRRTGVHYRGGFVMGLGAALDGQPLSRLPHGKRVQRQLLIYFDHIDRNEQSPDEVYQRAELKIPVLITRILVVFMNRTIDKRLKRSNCQSPL